MTADEFRALALALPGAVEKSHMGHPDFRVGERIFATLGPRDTWGAKGWTKVRLAAAEASVVGRALEAAWRVGSPVVHAIVKDWTKFSASPPK